MDDDGSGWGNQSRGNAATMSLLCTTRIRSRKVDVDEQDANSSLLWREVGKEHVQWVEMLHAFLIRAAHTDSFFFVLWLCDWWSLGMDERYKVFMIWTILFFSWERMRGMKLVAKCCGMWRRSIEEFISAALVILWWPKEGRNERNTFWHPPPFTWYQYSASIHMTSINSHINI